MFNPKENKIVARFYRTRRYRSDVMCGTNEIEGRRSMIVPLWTIVMFLPHFGIMPFRNIFAGIIRRIPTQLVVMDKLF